MYMFSVRFHRNISTLCNVSHVNKFYKKELLFLDPGILVPHKAWNLEAQERAEGEGGGGGGLGARLGAGEK